MSYEILLDDFLEELSKSGIDVSKIHITEPEYTAEYVNPSIKEKENSYINETEKASETHRVSSLAFSVSPILLFD